MLRRTKFIANKAKYVCNATIRRVSNVVDDSTAQAAQNSNETAQEQKSENHSSQLANDLVNSSEKRDGAKSVAISDEELRKRMERLSGDGGSAGIEYEDGQPRAMKRSVKNNMFRYI